VLQYTSEQLKNLEAFVLKELKETPVDKTEWSFYGGIPKPAKFLEPLNYDAKLLFKLRKVNLKRRRKTELINKRLKISPGIDQDMITNCLRVCRILLMPKDRLPLHINRHEGALKAAHLQTRYPGSFLLRTGEPCNPTLSISAQRYQSV